MRGNGKKSKRGETSSVNGLSGREVKLAAEVGEKSGAVTTLE